MVRSIWIGPVFGVLALTGLALGQTTTPLVPVAAGDAGVQIVTVKEANKPAQKCKVLKWWTEPGGIHAYEVQALDTGERMTIEEAPSLAPAAASGGGFRGVAMRIFHQGRQAEDLPPGKAMPPSDAVVANPPVNNPTVVVPAPPQSSPIGFGQPKGSGPAGIRPW